MKNSEKLAENIGNNTEKLAEDIINSDMYKKNQLFIDAGCYFGVKDRMSILYLLVSFIPLSLSIIMMSFAAYNWFWSFDPTSLFDVWTLLTHLIFFTVSLAIFSISIFIFKRKCSKKDFNEKIEKKKKK